MENFEFIIKTENGAPVGHPIFIENFKEVFSEEDINNLSQNWAFFRRKDIPQEIRDLQIENIFTVPESRYIWNELFVEDEWYLRDMTEEERVGILESIAANIDIRMKGLNNNLSILKKWAEIKKTSSSNPSAWDTWINSLPELPNPPVE
jgi:hypothetical protein